MTIDFDPMLAKLIVHAPNREAALRRLDTALSDFIVLELQLMSDSYAQYLRVKHFQKKAWLRLIIWIIFL